MSHLDASHSTSEGLQLVGDEDVVIGREEVVGGDRGGAIAIVFTGIEYEQPAMENAQTTRKSPEEDEMGEDATDEDEREEAEGAEDVDDEDSDIAEHEESEDDGHEEATDGENDETEILEDAEDEDEHTVVSEIWKRKKRAKHIESSTAVTLGRAMHKRIEELEGEIKRLKAENAKLVDTVDDQKAHMIVIDERNLGDRKDASKWRLFTSVSHLEGVSEDKRTTFFRDCDFKHTVDLESPLHWESVCKECLRNPRGLGEIWAQCPAAFAEFIFTTLKQYASLRTFIERYQGRVTVARVRTLLEKGELDQEEAMTEECVQETISNLCHHSLQILAGPKGNWRFTLAGINPVFDDAYRSGLGEHVDVSMGYGGVLHCPGLGITRTGGDSARWQWKIASPSHWKSILAAWKELEPRKALKKVLIFWPRTICEKQMQELKAEIMECTAIGGWVTTVVREPCTQETAPHYHSFLTEWAVESPNAGWTRVMAADTCATADGTPLSAMQIVHPWIRRDHWEYMVEAWALGRLWDTKRAKSQLEEKGFVRTSEGRQGKEGVNKPQANAEKKKAKKQREEEVEQKVEEKKGVWNSNFFCHYCQLPGHSAIKCFKRKKDEEMGVGQGTSGWNWRR